MKTRSNDLQRPLGTFDDSFFPLRFERGYNQLSHVNIVVSFFRRSVLKHKLLKLPFGKSPVILDSVEPRTIRHSVDKLNAMSDAVLFDVLSLMDRSIVYDHAKLFLVHFLTHTVNEVAKVYTFDRFRVKVSVNEAISVTDGSHYGYARLVMEHVSWPDVDTFAAPCILLH